MKQYLFIALGLWLLAVNLLAFILMGVDKNRAKKDAWRIKETTLFLPVLLGGGLGGIWGMNFFHHKTRHWYFRIGFPTILILEVSGALWSYWYFCLQ